MTEDISPRETPAAMAKRIAKRAMRRLLAFQFLISSKIDHAAVVKSVREDGVLSGRYIFMIVMACAIATLGLLLSSPAVIIGAMLISPLMGPIMLMGFSLTILDLHSLRRAIVTLAAGAAGALIISFLIVKLSPLNDATPEILARTRPNFFDLLVAIFSGLAGGYAVITGKGGTIVGVAIATALMPPLAVTGFGLAVGSMPVAGGAFFLFMTNLLAIALSVTVLARVYGFGTGYGPRRGYLQSALIVAVFAALSIPLGLALRDIAYETRATNLVRENLLAPFDGVQARVSDYFVSFPRGRPVQVEATILTRTRTPDAEAQVQQLLSQKLERNVEVTLSQVLIDEDKDLETAKILDLAESSLGAPLREEISRIEVMADKRRQEADVKAAATFALAGSDIDADTMTATLFAASDPAFSISAYRSMEARMSENFGDWKIAVVPPVGELPPIPFSDGSEELDENAGRVLADCVWALRRWGTQEVEAVGHASTSGELQRFDNRSLAFRRAQAVAARLEAEGFTATPAGEYRAANQKQGERDFGLQAYQKVRIRPK
ncbi:MAG: DUF389 domain-containing protein [Hyphomonas sp.]|uniref:DUF389 domain-containing protein n=1 Tax=Hyphomonas sp. TaxID=87 RepID=UPI0035273031